MLAVFCLRLSCGLLAALLLLRPSQINPRFYRTHFLTALALTAVATVFLSELAGLALWLLLAAALVLALAGSVVWMLEGAPGGKTILLLGVADLAAALVLASRATYPGEPPPWLAADDLTSAALLGSATTAMLIGHFYLIAPGMSLAPLLRLLGALGAAVLVRLAIALGGLWLWTAQPGRGTLETELLLWLTVRWGVGFVAPLVLGWMAWETARIRSTQSATGILYVVVIFCFLGELTSQLLLDKTHFIL